MKQLLTILLTFYVIPFTAQTAHDEYKEKHEAMEFLTSNMASKYGGNIKNDNYNIMVYYVRVSLH